nr:hypothetical protein BaRGS_019488 [Batillaria attramentaria]
MAAIGSTGEHLFLPECFEVSFADDKIIRGHVQSAREVQETLDAVNKEFNTAFNSWFKKINKEKLGPDAESRLLWYTDLQLQGTTCIVPGLVLQNDVMVCDRGGRPYNPKPTNVQKDEDHAYLRQKRSRLQLTKKTGCEAKVKIKTWTLFEDFSMEKATATKWKKAVKMKEIKEALKAGDMRETTVIQMEIPLAASHTNHTLAVENCISRTISREVRSKNTMAIVQGKTACLQNFHKKHADAFRQYVVCRLHEDTCRSIHFL